jgi:ATP-grasp domain
LESKKQPVVLLATSVSWPLSARLALRFIAYGCRTTAVCPAWHVLTHVRGLAAVYPYRALDPLSSLETAIRAEKPDLVVPCDDRVVWQMHEIHERRSDLRSLIEASLGAAAGYQILSRRERLLETARALAIRIPDTNRVTSEEDIRRWFSAGASSAVLKRDCTWGGEGIELVTSEREALAAFRKLSQNRGFATTVKRLVVNRDPLALWDWRRRAEPTITIQQMISGHPATAMLACWKGEVLGMLAVEVLGSQGATGAAFIVRTIENREVSVAAKALATQLGLTGFYGLDFMLESGTGFPYLIEVNPRCTQLGHLSMTDRGDLAGLLYAKLAGRTDPPPQARIDNDVVAFFPQAIQWSPESSLIRTGYHDVPWEAPALVCELLKEPWPDRQWSARLYHHFYPRERTSAVEFQQTGARTAS